MGLGSVGSNRRKEVVSSRIQTTNPVPFQTVAVDRFQILYEAHVLGGARHVHRTVPKGAVSSLSDRLKVSPVRFRLGGQIR